MRTLCKILLTASLLLFSSTINAEDDDSNSAILTQGPIDKGNPNRPRIPSFIFLECHYSIGHISFVIPSNILFLEVSISNNDDTLWEGFVTREYPETSIPVFPSGEYSIVCRTDGNQIFGGILTY